LLSSFIVTGLNVTGNLKDEWPGDLNGFTNTATRKGLIQMLVLTRKRTEMIKIGEDIVITVVHTSKGSVKLGIQAPSNVRVLRAELDQHSASSVASSDSESDVVDGPLFPADQFRQAFNVDYVADLEDQVLVCLAK